MRILKEEANIRPSITSFTGLEAVQETKTETRNSIDKALNIATKTTQNKIKKKR
jgi:hypothetical protein